MKIDLKRVFYYIVILVVFILIQGQVSGQTKKKREKEVTFQFSLFPGISTNGIESARYVNKYSINLFGGLSRGNKIFEAGLITNSNIRASSGLQLAGLGNIVGANILSFTPNDEQTEASENLLPDFAGMQTAGLFNYVGANFKGIQISGGLNVVGADFKGIQIAGFGNIVAGESLIGTQIGSLYNVCKGSVGGVQISTLVNYSDGDLLGLQAGLVNRAVAIYGKKSTPPTRGSGVQIGLINFSKSMDGTQIGLINFGGSVRGKQIGIINFFDRNGTKENSRMGTPIGLLNFGTKGSFIRVSYNELYNFNIEISTGNCLNCTWTQSGMPYTDANRIFNQNILIFGFDRSHDSWAFGYGFQKVLYNKASMLPKPENEKRMLSYGIKFMHLNNTFGSLNKSLNILTKINGDIGMRFKFIYLFAGLSPNFYLSETEDVQIKKLKRIEVASGKLKQFNWSISPGYQFGLQLSKVYRPNF